MNLTDQEKRIKVAEACGHTKWAKLGSVQVWMNPEGNPRNVEELPDYANDLNAMAEAEKTLTEDDFETYRWILWDECKRPQVREWKRAFLSSTAAQRFDAFGKTLNLW